MTRAAGLAVANAYPALAESATCKALKVCDGAGNCKPGKKTITFEYEPVDVRRSGEGEWRLTYNGKTVRAEGASHYGPFLWAEGSKDIQALMFSDERHVLWHSARNSGAVVRFMDCEEGS